MREFVGWGLMSLAALTAAINFYFSVLRYLLYRHMGWEYRFVSGLPVLGTICLVFALACVPQSMAAWLIAILIATVDTGGIPWFLIVILLEAFTWPKSVDSPSKKTPDKTDSLSVPPES